MWCNDTICACLHKWSIQEAPLNSVVSVFYCNEILYVQLWALSNLPYPMFTRCILCCVCVLYPWDSFLLWWETVLFEHCLSNQSTLCTPSSSVFMSLFTLAVSLLVVLWALRCQGWDLGLLHTSLCSGPLSSLTGPRDPIFWFHW